MTEAEFDAQINSNKEAITGYQQDIRKLEEQINELNNMKRQMGGLQDILHDTANQAESKISGMTNLWGAVASVLNGKFFSNLLTAVKGAEYSTADSGLGTSLEIIQDKIDELRKLIDQKQTAIQSCSSKIGSIQNEKEDYLRQKAQEEAASEERA